MLQSLATLLKIHVRDVASDVIVWKVPGGVKLAKMVSRLARLFRLLVVALTASSASLRPDGTEEDLHFVPVSVWTKSGTGTGSGV